MDSGSFEKSLSSNNFNYNFSSRLVKSANDLNKTPGQFRGKRSSKGDSGPKGVSSRQSSSWIERVFEKRECIKFIQDGNSDRCGCGRLSTAHSRLALSRFTTSMIRDDAIRQKPSFTLSLKENPIDFSSRFTTSVIESDVTRPKPNFNFSVDRNSADSCVKFITPTFKDEFAKPKPESTFSDNGNGTDFTPSSNTFGINNGVIRSGPNFVPTVEKNTISSSSEFTNSNVNNDVEESRLNFISQNENHINPNSRFTTPNSTLTRKKDVIEPKSNFNSSLADGSIDSPSKFTRSMITDDFKASRFDFELPSKKNSETFPRKWNIKEHTRATPTDSFGTIEFQGGPHPHKAHYVRLAFDSNPSDVIYLMEKVWNLPKPKLVISIHGGVGNFNVPDKFGKRFREGLLKAAQTTGAWIITSGIDSGVVRHVAQALDEAGISARMRSQILLIGIAPWGLVRRREKLIGLDSKVTYEHPSYSQKNRHHPVLNDRHSYFLLVDNGTIGRYGADIILRKRFEDYLAQKVSLRCGPERTPIIGVTVEGGLCTINSVLEYLTGTPPIPVIVCEGSGRASDFIAFAEKHADKDGKLPAVYHDQLLSKIKEKLVYNHTSAEKIVEIISECAKHKDLLTVYRLSETENGDDVDQVILRALLKGDNLSLIEQLQLTLAWDRVDMARSEIFSSDQDLPPQALYPIMMNCLLLNRVDFFKLLIEQGVSMKKFLTIQRLEQLYNTEPEQLSILYHLLGTSDKAPEEEKFSLPEIGSAVEKLMENAYRCHYTKDFKYPFNELMIWAVLTRRHELAKCIWNHGEEAMAKALVAIRLYRGMAKLAAGDYTEVEVSKQLREYAEDFKTCSFELLNHCYQQDDVMTMKMMTAELPNWGHQTCLSLAVIANNRKLLAHPCCQVLLAELWHGGLRFRSQSNIKVLLAVFFPPTILLLDFKKPTYQSKSKKPITSVDESEDEENKQGAPFNLSLPTIFKANSNLTNRLLGKRNSSLMGPKFSRVDTEPESEILMTPLSPDPPPDSEIEPKRVQIISNKVSASEVFRSNLSTASSYQSTATLKSWFRDCKSNFSLFYRAPITSFWIWAISFFFFLNTFIYTLLIEYPLEVSYLEWYLSAYVAAFGLEHFRKLLATESSSQMEKFHVFYNSYWNLLTTICIVTYFIGFAFRFDEATIHTHSRIIMASNSVLWHMKVYDYLSVHPKVGPYIMMAGKMIRAMSYIIVMLLVTLMAFGVARQSITFPHEKWGWILVRNIFYKPYFMLYGEVYAGEIDTCGDEGTNCVPGGWLPPIFMTIFLIAANILLINMLIAIFNNIFNVTNAMSHQVWMFQRYGQVLEYKNTPILPPPFTPIIHLWMLLKFSCRKLSNGRRRKNSERIAQDPGLDLAIKLYLDEEELQKIRDFEEDCMDDLSRKHEISPLINQKKKEDPINELIQENTQLKAELDQVRSQLNLINHGQTRILEVLQNLSTANRSHCDFPTVNPSNSSTSSRWEPALGSDRAGSVPQAARDDFVHDGLQKETHPKDAMLTTSAPMSRPTSLATTTPGWERKNTNGPSNSVQLRKKRIMRTRNSISLSEDIEQMIEMSSAIQPEIMTPSIQESSVSRKDSSSGSSSTSSRSSSVISVASLNGIIIK